MSEALVGERCQGGKITRGFGLLTLAYVDHLHNEHISGHTTCFGKMLWVMLRLEAWLAARGL